MSKKIRILLVLISVVSIVFVLKDISFSAEKSNKKVPPNTATKDASAYDPEDKKDDKLDKSMRFTGPVSVDPLDDKEAKEEVKENDENEIKDENLNNKQANENPDTNERGESDTLVE